MEKINFVFVENYLSLNSVFETVNQMKADEIFNFNSSDKCLELNFKPVWM